jgi:twitching motility protein PilT
MFPKEEQNRIRITLASVLSGVICQRLVKTVDGKRAAALEVMIQTPRIVDLIAQDNDSELLDTIEGGREIYGSQSFDQALLALYCEKKISKEVAFEHATSPSDLKLKLD